MIDKLNDNSEAVLKARYYLSEEEDWPALCRRVVDNVVPISCSRYNYTDEEIDTLSKNMFEHINNLEFLPNSPTMFNAGTEHPMLSACFVIGVPDNLPGIYDAVKESAIIHKMGGGVGFSLSDLRCRGSRIATTHGHSGGAVSFLKVFAHGTSEITAAGKRKGANMAMLRIDHGDVEEFIKCKSLEGEISNFNLSVQLTDSFMEACKKDASFDLVDPKDNSIVKTVSAKELMKLVAYHSWKNGDPGVCFIDAVNRENPTPHIGEITSSNPCQPGWAPVLTPEGIKTFNDVSVGCIIWSGERWTSVSRKVSSGVRTVYAFRTEVGTFYGTEDHEVVQRGKKVPVKEARSIDRCFSPFEPLPLVPGKVSYDILNIQYLGEEEVFDITVRDEEHTYWTDGLLVSNCGEYYSSPKNSCNLGSLNLVKCVTDEKEFDWDAFRFRVYNCVEYLDCIIDANEYPLKDIEEMSQKTRPVGLGVMGFADALILMGIKYDSEEGFLFARELSEKLSYYSLEASIELAKKRGPYKEFRAENHRYEKATKLGTLDWDGLVAKIEKHGLRNSHTTLLAPTGTIARIANEVSSGMEPLFALSFKSNILDGQVHEYKHRLHQMFLDGSLDVNEEVFVCAKDISWQNHIRMQAEWQKFIHNGISKTINMLNSVTEEDVYDAYMMAYEYGLKGVTVYREGSKKYEVLVSSESKNVKEPGIFDYVTPMKRPIQLECDIHHTQVKGEKWVVLVGLLDGKPYEIFGGLQKFIELPKKHTKGIISKKANKTAKSRYDLIINKGTEDELIIRDIPNAFEDQNHGVLSRLISLSLRHNARPNYISEQLFKDTDFDFQTYAKVAGRILKRYIPEGEKPESSKTCPLCDNSLGYSEGCVSCLSCGWSKCS